MVEAVLTLFSILLLSMLKFIAGPTLGYAAGYPYLLSVGITITGMMASVFLFTYLGKLLRDKIIKRLFPSGKKFNKRTRRFVKIWRQYGIIGIAAITPLLLSPIGGTLLLASTGTKKHKIVIYMLISAIFWSFIITGAVYLFGENVLKKYI